MDEIHFLCQKNYFISLRLNVGLKFGIGETRTEKRRKIQPKKKNQSNETLNLNFKQLLESLTIEGMNLRERIRVMLMLMFCYSLNLV